MIGTWFKDEWLITRQAAKLFFLSTVAAAPAPKATAAGTSSATQNVITFASTPANRVAGSMMTLVGVTPAGYNRNWYLTSKTRRTTTMHYFSSQSNLVNNSVQGTGGCPLWQNAGEYPIVPFGASNYSLQSCVSLTRQNVYFGNIDAAATTLLPFAGKTITGVGATPTTLVANTTEILQSQLVSSKAASSNWVRLQ